MRHKEKHRQAEYNRNIKVKLAQIENVIENFHKKCKECPSCTCVICYRLLLKNEVKKLNIPKYSNQDLIATSIQLSGLHQTRPECENECSECAKWICYTCDRNLIQEKVPNQALVNNMALPPLPECLCELNQLEKHLISPIIPFMKILPLPKGQQKGIHGPVVCVPSDMTKVTEILPRQLSDNTLVKIKLKRKLEYKGHHLFQQVSLQKIQAALHYLKTINPNFSGEYLTYLPEN